MNDPRGSMWRKWDLHVHTPESLVHGYSGPEPWERFLKDLEKLPPTFKVIGINDYIFLDGYKRILDEKAKGRVSNIDLFLPVIELRLDKFGGSTGHLSRVNYHIVFSDKLSPEIIEQQFLNALSSKYVLTPQYDHLRTSGKWAALPTKKSLKDLGEMIIQTVPEAERARFRDPLTEGFNSLCINLTELQKVLESHYFKSNFVTAVGKTEWADIKWNDHAIAEKKNLINTADLVFISAESRDLWEKAKSSLLGAGVNSRLLDCSDAHYFSDSTEKDRIGKCFTWIKADTTFEGLHQVLNEPDGRTYIGEEPPKLVWVRNNKTKFIDSVEIRRKTEATLAEKWFNNKIMLNTDLVAIIGNQGKGKSSVTDTIGLLGNTKQHKDFTFLSPERFRQPKDNKAKHFVAVLTWMSGLTVQKGLDDLVDEQQPELVKYIPQNFLEKICNEIGGPNETAFDRELKQVIFSHVDSVGRLGKFTLDDLLDDKTAEANDKILILQEGLNHVNEEIVALEEESQPEYQKIIENALAIKQAELDSLKKAKPLEVLKPESDPQKQQQSAQISEIIEEKKKQLGEYEVTILLANDELVKQAKLISTAAKLVARVDNLELQINKFKTDSEVDLASIGVSFEKIVKITLDREPLREKQRLFSDLKKKTEEEIDPSKANSAARKRHELQREIGELELKLDEPNKKYQNYLTALEEWQKQEEKILGNEGEAGSIKYYEKQLENLKNVPTLLAQARARRIEKAKEIHATIRSLAETYRELYGPVHQFIEERPLARQKLRLNFKVNIVNTGFQDDFFDVVSHGVSGTFCGIEEGQKRLQEILQRHNFDTEEEVLAFLGEIMEALEHDKRAGGNPVRMSDQLRKGKSVVTLYDLIFGLAYLKPRYALRMGEKELSELSPGERGTLLLIFYLLVDKDVIPLVIDQPEGNLDNQTVYEQLVACIKEAKERRQIIIVTHNPNLAVVCDAEQIICADLDKVANYKMTYFSGAIENTAINKAIVDILEGTKPAFDNRDSKYL